jgi:ribonuclease III
MKRETPEEFANRLKVPFSDLSLLSRALTHRSYSNEHPDESEDNERLEFLGDAVLDFVVGDWLYNKFPEMEEGELTQMRSALVQSPQLADFGRQIGVGYALRLGRGEMKSGGNLRDSLLCDAFESFIGALYIHHGIKFVQNFIISFLDPASEEILKSHKNEDPKSTLQEWAQACGFTTPHYDLVKVNGPDHQREFDVRVMINDLNFGNGTGSSKQAAEKAAAVEALNTIRKKNSGEI